MLSSMVLGHNYIIKFSSIAIGKLSHKTQQLWYRRGRDRMVVGVITTYAINANHH